MMDSPPDFFQHTPMLFKDACPPYVYGGMTYTAADLYTIQTQSEILTVWACKYTVIAKHTHKHTLTGTDIQLSTRVSERHFFVEQQITSSA